MDFEQEFDLDAKGTHRVKIDTIKNMDSRAYVDKDNHGNMVRRLDQQRIRDMFPFTPKQEKNLPADRIVEIRISRRGIFQGKDKFGFCFFISDWAIDEKFGVQRLDGKKYETMKIEILTVAEMKALPFVYDLGDRLIKMLDCTFADRAPYFPQYYENDLPVDRIVEVTEQWDGTLSQDEHNGTHRIYSPWMVKNYIR